MRICPMCEVGHERFTIREHKFPYGEAGPSQVMLRTPMIVWCCDNPECGEMSMDWMGEQIIDHTVRMWHIYLEMQRQDQESYDSQIPRT